MLKSLCLLVQLFVLLAVSSSYAGQVTSFIYHRFDETRYPSTNISTDIFTQQLDYVSASKIEIMSLGEVADRLAKGEKLPDHAISFCVDDAFRSFSEAGMPIIRRYNLPVTLFVNTDSVGTPGYLNWDELKQLAEEGVEIGNHTASHAYLVELKNNESLQQWEERIRTDIEKAQSQFEKHLGFKPTLFAYPYGEYSDRVVDVIKSLGFNAAFAQQSGVIYDQSDRFILPRFPMGGPFATLKGFKNKLAMGPLTVSAADPADPVIIDNPPVLHFQVAGKEINAQRFNCFVQGDNRCRVTKDEQKGTGWYQITAEKPLTGRRNKYTVTLQSAEGQWLWYSHLWVNAKNPAIKKE